ncbi:MAG: 4-(cytidine 5'-diphospho)-2-C-methyl-D-erythritol kinase, partial [Lautropia sp.]|nr:4-(cytidine 5'-diphospho)-2-C-methyl-D-erythritol kinase [Lautropia sp.]
TGRRADGYHLLETVFQFVDLQDSLDLRLRDDGLLGRLGPPGDIPPETDLTLRAARALQEATSCRFGVDITLRKSIPIGAGLGGGSSDAATVLLGLNRLWQLDLDRSCLSDIAGTLGADVPVFIFGRNAFATGIGDQLRPIDLPPRWFVLLMPPVAVATAGVFGDAKLTRNTKPITIFGFAEQAPGLGGRNDLQPVVLKRQPAVKAALVVLTNETRAVDAAAATSVRMTGSGACVFAALERFDVAQEIAQRVLRHNVGTVHVVCGLAKHPLGSRQVG